MNPELWHRAFAANPMAPTVPWIMQGHTATHMGLQLRHTEGKGEEQRLWGRRIEQPACP